MDDIKDTLLKIIKIMKDTDENNPVTASQISKKLESQYGIKAERKAISRNIKLLKENKYSIETFSDKRRGCYLVSDFEDWELKILIDAVASSVFLTKQQSEKLIKKLYKLTGKSTRDMLSKIPPVFKKNKPQFSIAKSNIDAVLSAIASKHKVTFQYAASSANNVKNLKRNGFMYTVSPYSLIWENNSCCLIGCTDGHQSLSSYRLNKIVNIKISEEKSTSFGVISNNNMQSEICEFAERNIYHYGGKTVYLKLEFHEKMLERISETLGEPRNVQNNNGLCNATVITYDGAGLYFWLMQYAEHVRIISPQAVVDNYKRKLKAIISKYN